MQPINLNDYEALAATRLDAAAWDYLQGGAENELTLHENVAAFARIRLRPRMLVDVSTRDLRAAVLGTPVSMPILVAPTAYHGLAHPDGECATARAAGEAETVMVVSTFATRSLEEVAQAAAGPLWFQLYVYSDRSVSEALVRRAEAAGYRALVLTVDAPRLGTRERDVRNGFGLPPHLTMANFAEQYASIYNREPGASSLAAHFTALLDPSLTWEAVAWLRGITSLPILVKGVLTAEDAELAIAHSADGIIVSNHGGRQLDGVPAAIEALTEVAAATAGRCEVYLDGGVRRGTDVLKALAIGAHAVLVGRPVLWGLAVDGAAGARRVLELLRAELDLALALSGRPALASVDRSLVKLP
jgi:isopentenyl diphosphate isomerase/L-lactate dehydrogenase-like FMN-dependent dehydrogenase